MVGMLQHFNVCVGLIFLHYTAVWCVFDSSVLPDVRVPLLFQLANTLKTHASRCALDQAGWKC